MFIKRLKPNVYDVFVDNGWNSWTRVRRVGAHLQYVAGAYLNRAALNVAKERIIRR
jgi:hypothetical protein